jgi:hypothetical protein
MNLSWKRKVGVPWVDTVEKRFEADKAAEWYEGAEPLRAVNCKIAVAVSRTCLTSSLLYRSSKLGSACAGGGSISPAFILARNGRWLAQAAFLAAHRCARLFWFVA